VSRSSAVQGHTILEEREINIIGPVKGKDSSVISEINQQQTNSFVSKFIKTVKYLIGFDL